MEDWKDHICHTFVETRGNVSAAAKKLGITKEHLFRYIQKTKHAQEALEEARALHADDELDLAVSLNYLFMQDWKNNPALASKHVIYTLDRKGHVRGYLKDSGDIPINKDIEFKFDQSMDQVLSLLGSDRKIDDNNINNDTKS